MNDTFLNQRVNSVIGMLLLGSVALGAILVMLNANEWSNPVEEAMLARTTISQ